MTVIEMCWNRFVKINATAKHY